MKEYVKMPIKEEEKKNGLPVYAINEKEYISWEIELEKIHLCYLLCFFPT